MLLPETNLRCAEAGITVEPYGGGNVRRHPNPPKSLTLFKIGEGACKEIDQRDERIVNPF